jgi:hypothetical protein
MIGRYVRHPVEELRFRTVTRPDGSTFPEQLLSEGETRSFLETLGVMEFATFCRSQGIETWPVGLHELVRKVSAYKRGTSL